MTDILERAKAVIAEAQSCGHTRYEELSSNALDELLPDAIAEIERLRSALELEKNGSKDWREIAVKHDARIKEMEAEREWICGKCNRVFQHESLRKGFSCLLCPECSQPIKPAFQWQEEYLHKLEAAFLETKFQELMWIDGNDCGPELYTEDELREKAREALEELRRG